MKKRLLVLWLLFQGIFIFASSFSFQVIQHCDELDEVCPAVHVFEDELLNYFFENGQIVSNEPAAVSISKTADEKLVQSSLANAMDGSFSNFIEIDVYLTDSDGSASSTVKQKYFNKIVWKSYSVITGKVSIEHKKVFTSKKEDSDAMSGSYAVETAVDIQKSLKSGK